MKISNLEVNMSCTITLVVKTANARKTRSDKPYLVLELFDGVDTITGNYWDWTSGNIPEVNAILDVTATVTEWQGKKQLNISALRSNTTRHLAEFMPSNGVDVGKVYNDAYALVSEVKDDALRSLGLVVLEALQERWTTVPAARGVHHAYVGGTLIHSYGVAKLAKAIAEQIPEANVDLCVIGGMLHDIGKLFTYKMNGVSIDMTDDGQLYDHIFMGAEFIGNYADEVIDSDDFLNMKKLQLLRHIILSHHGHLDFGSPVTPQCIEAFIVHHADSVDSTAEQIRTAARKVPSGSKWTERIYTLNNRSQLDPYYVKQVMRDLDNVEEEVTTG